MKWFTIGGSRRRVQERRYIFIVTYARSGSTLLQKIIASVPGCYMAGENNDVLAGLFRAYRAAVEAKAEQGDSPRTAAGDPWRGAHLIDPERFNERMVRAFVDEVLKPPASARWVGFKEVRYFDHEHDLTAYLDYIRHAFPGALMVFNRRRAEDVAKSAWWRTHPGDIAASVRAFDSLVADYAKTHPQYSVVTDYDAFTQDAGHLAPLFARLGAPFSEEAVQKIMAERLDH